MSLTADRPSQFVQPAFDKFANGPRIHEFMQEMNRETFAKYDVMTIGEVSRTSTLCRVL